MLFIAESNAGRLLRIDLNDPNPTSTSLSISGLDQAINCVISDYYGSSVKSGVLSPKGKIDIEQLATGWYILTLENGKSYSFNKK